MEKLQCGAVGGCEVAGGALGGNRGDGEVEKVQEHGKDLTLSWGLGPGDMRKTGEGKRQKSVGSEFSLFPIFIPTKTTELAIFSATNMQTDRNE